MKGPIRAQASEYNYLSYRMTIYSLIDSISDYVLWYYRLQLKIYRHIFETYYDAVASYIYVVSTHPDNGDEPWIGPVPCL